MDIARIIGHIVATAKDPALEGVCLRIIQPLDEYLNSVGAPLIATDSSCLRDSGEIIFYVSSGDAIYTGINDNPMPVDAAIMGRVDQINLDNNG